MLRAVLVLTLLLGTSAAWAEEAKGANLDLEVFGFKQSLDTASGRCKLTSDLEMAKFVEAVPVLQKMGMLNSDPNIVNVREKPTTIASVFMMQMAIPAIQATFTEASKATQCQFEHYVTTTNDYGNDERWLLFSYGFDRTTFNKVNWERLPVGNLIKISRGFKPSSRFVAKMAEEK